MYYDEYASPIGTLWIYGREGVLEGLSFCRSLPESLKPAPAGTFDRVIAWLDDYFAGVVSKPEFLLEPKGTHFQKLVWDLLCRISWGETRTYGDLAREAAAILGKERMSAQAVGQAVGRNPIVIIIPCHRILGAGGKLTGYAYGLEKKQWLLNHEQNRR